MKFLVAVLATVVMSACAAPSTFYHHSPLTYSAVIYQPVHTSSQWQAQSGLGGLVYGYQGDPSAKSEIKTLDPSKLQTVNYVVDPLGFQVAVVNLPTPPVCDEKATESVEDTSEVKPTRTENLEIVTELKKDEVPEVAVLKDPEQVNDTDEDTTVKIEDLESVTEIMNDEAPEVASKEDPEPVEDIDEGTTVKTEDFESATEIINDEGSEVALLKEPESVEDTPDVEATKLEDLDSVSEVKNDEASEVAVLKDPEEAKDTDEGTTTKIVDFKTITEVKNDEVPVAIPKVALFRAPKQIEDNDDVKAARAEHLKAIELAKAEHFKAVEAVKTHSPDPVYYSAPFSYSTHPVVTLKSDVNNQAIPLFQWWSTFFPPRHSH